MEINSISLILALLRYIHSDFLNAFIFFPSLFSYLLHVLCPILELFVNVTVITLNSNSPIDLGLFHPEFSLHMDFLLLARDYCLFHSMVPLTYTGHRMKENTRINIMMHAP